MSEFMLGYFYDDSLSRQDRIMLEEFLGRGRTASVYGIRDRDAVCKLFLPEFRDQFDQEKEVLSNLAAKTPAGKRHLFLSLIGVNEKELAFIMSPKGMEIAKSSSEQRYEIVSRQFECLQVLRKTGYVHRGIVTRHFLTRESDPANVFLVDFGFTQQSGERLSFRGSPNYAPVELLEACAHHFKYEIHPRHDWISLINCLSMELHGGEENFQRSLDYFRAQKSDEFKAIGEFWTAYYKKFPCCGKFLELCYDADDDATFDKIANEFQKHYKKFKSNNIRIKSFLKIEK